MNSNKYLLVFVLLFCGATVFYSYKTSKEVKSLKEQIAVTEGKVDSLMTATENVDQSTKATSVTASYRLEDRYVIGEVVLPEYLSSQAGTITVNITVSRMGQVNKTRVADGATITDPEIVEAVRKAALKTVFNPNLDAPEASMGTITYTFKKK